MDTQSNIDFVKIDWSKIDREKAEFICKEAIGHLESIHESNDNITSRAIGILSFSLPVLTALTGFFVLQWGNLSTPIISVSICSMVLLSVILILLLLILLPKGSNSTQAGPIEYFTDDFYLSSMENIFKKNIQTLHQCINEDYAIIKSRFILLRVAIILFAGFPIISTVVWLVAFLVTKP
jgi:hypothetical protein